MKKKAETVLLVVFLVGVRCCNTHAAESARPISRYHVEKTVISSRGSLPISLAVHILPQLADAFSQDWCSAQSGVRASCLEINRGMRTERDLKKLGLGVALGLADYRLSRQKPVLKWIGRGIVYGLSAYAVQRNIRNGQIVRAANR